MWKDKRILTEEEVYAGKDKVIDKNFIYFDDNTCIEIKYGNTNAVVSNNYYSINNNFYDANSNFTINYYKLVNILPIDIPLYKWSKVFHNEDGPAQISYMNSKVTVEQYYIDGEYYRKDGPAYVSYNNDKIYKEIFYKNGIMVKDISYYSNGNKQTEYFYSDVNLTQYGSTLNNYHRKDGPAAISYYFNGKIRSEQYYINGVAQNLIIIDKNNLNASHISASHKEYDIDGNLIYSEFKDNGKTSNLNGPAIIDKRGSKSKKHYYIDGQKIYSYITWLMKK